MALSESDRTLRLITVLTWIPAMALLISFGVLAEYVVLSLSLIPMTFSAILGIHKILSKKPHRAFTICMDIFIASFMFGLTVPGIIYLRRGVGRSWWIRDEAVMLGAFATFPVMVNFTIHLWFTLREIKIFGLPKCPHCQRDLRLLWDMSSNGSSSHVSDHKDSYVAVPREVTTDDAEAGPSMVETPRPSVDDDTAQLL